MKKTGIVYPGFEHPVDEYGYWNINISFTDNDGMEDEAQFDVDPNMEGDKCWLELETYGRIFPKNLASVRIQ